MVPRILVTSGRSLPSGLWFLYGLYTLASLSHYVHNAEFIFLYPGLPGWMDRETVYWAWLVVAGVGLAGLGLLSRGWTLCGALVLAVYGALGLDGFLHYRLGPCSDHTWLANLTIFAEGLTGSALALAVLVGTFSGLATRRPLAR
ncbi:MAG: hypothetical protein WCK08_08010 [Betaproteobacteria bacterium]